MGLVTARHPGTEFHLDELEWAGAGRKKAQEAQKNAFYSTVDYHAFSPQISLFNRPAWVGPCCLFVEEVSYFMLIFHGQGGYY